MALKKLSHQDKKIFTRYLKKGGHELSVYTFENIYIWKDIYDISWELINSRLGVFFKDKIGCFLYLAPLGDAPDPSTLGEVFRIMDRFNKNREISRIENIEEPEAKAYQDLGYEVREKFPEYVCLRHELAELKGNKYKHKRALCNHFVKNYSYEYVPYSRKYRQDCLKLYNSWMRERKLKNEDPMYRYMLLDSRICIKTLLGGYRYLNCIGRVVKVNGRVKAFTFGFEVNSDTFAIVYEITDLSARGLSQFIFREFCSDMKPYKFINIMDDSGIENLKKAKLSYHPARLVRSYIARRKNA